MYAPGPATTNANRLRREQSTGGLRAYSGTMRLKVTPPVVAVGSLVALVLLGVALYLPGRHDDTRPPLVAYVAASFRPPMEAIARDYEAATGQRVELRLGASEDILTRAALVQPSDPADLFLPADESYIQMARERGLVAESRPVAVMRGVVLAAPGNSKQIAHWPDMLVGRTRVAVANPAAAIGKLTRDHLARTGRWAELQPHVVDTGTVTEAANAAKVGSVDAAIVWDAVTNNYPGQQVLHLPELDGVTARVELAVLNQSRNAGAARQFALYVVEGPGRERFRELGFHLAEGPP